MNPLIASVLALATMATAVGCGGDDSASKSDGSAHGGAGGAVAAGTGGAGPQQASASSASAAEAVTSAGAGGGPSWSTGAYQFWKGGYPVPADCATQTAESPCVSCVKNGCCGASFACLGDTNCTCWMGCMGQTDDVTVCCAKCGVPGSVTSSLADCAQDNCGICKQQLLTCVD